MNSQCIRSERGFLDTGGLVRTPATARPNALMTLLSEAGEMLRGAIEAPLRHAEGRASRGELDGLPGHLRKDIGLDN